MLRKPPRHQEAIARKAEEFCVEYDPLEYLLTCLIDGNGTRKDRRRQTDLQNAYEAITHKKRKRVETPDSEVGVALFEYTAQKEINYDYQLSPEAGGPVVESKEDERRYRVRGNKGIVSLTVEVVGDTNDNLHGYVEERMAGTYQNVLLQADPEGYKDAQLARFLLHDVKAERDLFKDMRKVAELLQKHGVHMNLARPFWRVNSP